MTPTVGRIVHYTNLGDADGKYPPTQCAAIITAVEKQEPPDTVGVAWPMPAVSLAILYPTGLFFRQSVPYSSDYARGHWTWPPRVEG